MYQEFIGRW
ncbi:rCG27130 [Rattus norvegicus]|uniref:RCG27130 n=1 Tax=Rattus norvegicus TaxID=10116 RepID=A6HPY9_RAT|nr:rCG27130 [Rattus norvegicus]